MCGLVLLCIGLSIVSLSAGGRTLFKNVLDLHSLDCITLGLPFAADGGSLAYSWVMCCSVLVSIGLHAFCLPTISLSVSQSTRSWVATHWWVPNPQFGNYCFKALYKFIIVVLIYCHWATRWWNAKENSFPFNRCAGEEALGRRNLSSVSNKSCACWNSLLFTVMKWALSSFAPYLASDLWLICSKDSGGGGRLCVCVLQSTCC